MNFKEKVEARAAKMASVVSGSTGSLISSGSSSGTNEDCVINEDHFSSSCSSLELEDIQEAIEGVGSCLIIKGWTLYLSLENRNFDLVTRCVEPFLRQRRGRMQGRNLSIVL